jgi:hypothetical protein
MGLPSCVLRISGSAPNNPSKVTSFIDPAILIPFDLRASGFYFYRNSLDIPPQLQRDREDVTITP